VPERNWNRATHLLDRARDMGDKTAILFERERISFADLAARVRATAGGLARLGIGKGTAVGIMLPSTPDFVVVQQALFLLGATVSPLNIFYRPGEVLHIVRSCDLAYLVLASDLAERATMLGPEEAPTFRSCVFVDRDRSEGDHALSLPQAVAAGVPVSDPAPVAADDVVQLLNTSATTGKSKGVMLTAANLAANYDRTPEWLGLSGDDVILCALPLYNTFGLNQCVNATLVTGATLVLLPRFDARRCIEAVLRHGCTFIPAVPTMLQKIVDDPSIAPWSLRTVSGVMTGGAPVPATLLRRIVETMGAGTKVLTGYGLTEATALVTLTPVTLGEDGEVVRGRTIGRVLDGMNLAILDDDGGCRAAGEVGEIAVRGPNLMTGYHRAPEDTRAALRDGWLRTGDLGYLDADGYAYIVDRKKDVIIRGGQNIYPADIEEVLYQVEGVAEAAAVGEPDEVLGEVPVAYVALRQGADVSPSKLLAHCEAELARYKVPHEIRILSDLPKGPTGKILRRALRPQVPA
jgi:long-chain acyl-CoA synthetase